MPRGTTAAWKTYGLLIGVLTLMGWAQVHTAGGAAAREVDRVVALKLRTEYLPASITVEGDPERRAIQAIEVSGQVPSRGDGEGLIRFDTRPAELNEFGDVVRQSAQGPEPIRIELRRVTQATIDAQSSRLPTNSRATVGWRLYDIVFPDAAFAGQFRLVLGTTNLGPHRLLVYRPSNPGDQQSREAQRHILTLRGDPPAESPLPDAPVGRTIDLTGYYTASDGHVRRIELRGQLDGPGKLEMDPNYLTFDLFGEMVMTTLMGHQPQEVTLARRNLDDPLGLRRRLYQVVPKDERNRDRCVLVLGHTEARPHRLIIYRGEQAQSIVPVFDPKRRYQERALAELVEVSPEERRAIAELRSGLGHEFTFQIEAEQITKLTVTTRGELAGMNRPLGGLRQLKSLWFSGSQINREGLPGLRGLERLEHLGFSDARFHEAAFASLKDLRSLTSLMFYACEGVTDAAVRHLSGLTNLTSLWIYSEAFWRDPNWQALSLTDAGVAPLQGLKRLRHLNLHGQNLSDRSLTMISSLAVLEHLSLTGTAITDSGLIHLAGLTNLRELRLWETSVTEAGVAALKAKLPNLKIEVGDRNGRG